MIDEQIAKLRAINEDKHQQAGRDIRHAEVVDSSLQTQEVFVRTIKSLVEFLENKVDKTVILNQLEEIGTPDAFKVVDAVDSLHETLKTHENTDLTEITSVMNSVLDEVRQLPKDQVELPEQKFVDYSKQLTSLEKAVKAVEKVVKAQKLIAEAPIVNVPETQVNVEAPDLKPLQESIAEVVSAVTGIVIPELDTTSLEGLVEKSNKLLNEILNKPVASGGGGGGRATPYETSTGVPYFVIVESDGSLPVTIKNTDYATETKQDEIIDAIEAIPTTDVSGIYSKPIDAYALSNIDDSTSTEYYGYERADGAWYIKKVDSNILTFVSGSSNYSTAWTNRASQTYVAYSGAF